MDVDCEPQSWGRGGHRRSGIVPSERALVSSHRPSIVTLPLSLRVSEILPLLCFSTPLFPPPTYSFPKSSQRFPGSKWMAFGLRFYEDRSCLTNSPCNYFPKFPTYVITRQTDGQRTYDCKTTLCAIGLVHRAVKKVSKYSRLLKSDCHLFSVGDLT